MVMVIGRSGVLKRVGVDEREKAWTWSDGNGGDLAGDCEVLAGNGAESGIG